MITLLQAVPADAGNPIQQFFSMVLDYVVNKQWWPLASLMITGFVAASRYFVPKWHTGLGAWFNTDRGGVVLNFIWGLLGAAATTIGAWKSPDWKLLVTTLLTTGGSIVSYVIYKKGIKGGTKPDDAMPVVTNDVAKPIEPPPPIRPGALLPFILIPFLFAHAGCYCWQAAHVQEPKCVIAHQTVDCTSSSVQSLVPLILPLITDLIGGTNVDWNAVLQRLEGAGFQEGGCLLAALENDFVNKAKASPKLVAQADGLRKALSEFKMHFNASDVKFCIRADSRTVCQ